MREEQTAAGYLGPEHVGITLRIGRPWEDWTAGVIERIDRQSDNARLVYLSGHEYPFTLRNGEGAHIFLFVPD